MSFNADSSRLDDQINFDADASPEVDKMKKQKSAFSSISQEALPHAQRLVLDHRQMRASAVGAIPRQALLRWMMDGRLRS
jgi:hypothetical protein